MAENFGASNSTLTPDALIAGAMDIVSKPITILSGVGSLTRGALLGRINIGSISAGTVVGTGTQTISAPTGGSDTLVGVYTIRQETAGATGRFVIVDPNGKEVGGGVIGTAVTGNPHLNFTITTGGTPTVGDYFLVTVAAGSFKYKLYANDDLVGAAHPDAILADAADATSADVVTIGYISGEFSEKFVSDNSGAGGTNYGSSSATIQRTVKDELRNKGIYFKDTTRIA